MKFHLCSSIPINSLWEALEMKAQSPEKFMNVSDMQVPDEEVFLSCNKMIKAKNITMKKRIWINVVTREITLQPLDPNTDTPNCTRSV